MNLSADSANSGSAETVTVRRALEEDMMTATEIEIKLQLKDLPEFKEFVASLQRRLDMLEIQLDTVRLERDEWERQYDQLLESVRQANLIP